MKKEKSFTFKGDDTDHIIKLKKRRFPWWIFLLLLLIIPFLLYWQRDIKIQVVNNINQEIIANANLSIESSNLFSSDKKEVKTNENGEFILHQVSYFNTVTIISKNDNFHKKDTIYSSYHPFSNEIENVKLGLIPLTYALDVVLCVDATGSMGNFISNIKKNAISFHQDTEEAMQKNGKLIKNMRVRIIAFRDFYDKDEEIFKTDFFKLPEQQKGYAKSIGKLIASGGGDQPETALEALSIAFKSEWFETSDYKRQIVVLWTDEAAHPLEKNKDSKPSKYPENMPKNFVELSNIWQSISKTARLVIFAPEKKYPWQETEKQWKNVTFYPSKAGSGLREINYEKVLDAIAKGI